MAQINKLSPEDESRGEKYITVTNMIIQQWLICNGNICGISYSSGELSRFLDVDVSYIQIYMRDQVIRSNIWDPTQQKEILQGLMGQQLAWALEDRLEVQNQVDVLKRSQGNTYKPFISGELNKALKLKLETSSSLQALFRNLTGGSSGSTSIINILNQQNIHQNNNDEYVTTEKALEILDSTPSGMDSDNVLELEAKYNIALPEVNALKQEGVDTDKEGLNFSGTEMNQIVDNYKGSIEVADKELAELVEDITEYEEVDHHDTRRQIEYLEDFDSDDPEMQIYD